MTKKKCIKLERIFKCIKSLKIPADEVDYLNNIQSRFERALMILAYYGAYGNAFRK